MKNILIIIVLFASAFGFAQDKDKDKTSVLNRKHELKIGAIHLLGGPLLEGTYEYIYSKYFTYTVFYCRYYNILNLQYVDFSLGLQENYIF